MRHRRWVVLLALFVIAVLPLLYLGLRVASYNPAFKRAVLSRMLPEGGGELSVGELEVGLASLRLGDVSIDLGPTGRIVIVSASLDFSLARFLTGGFDARESLDSVIVSTAEVELEIGHDGTDDARDAGREGIGEGRVSDLDVREVFDLLPNYLGVSDGTLRIIDASTGRTLEIASIDLLIQKRDDSMADIRAVGSCLGGSDNLELDIAWDGTAGSTTLEAVLNDAMLTPDLPGAEALPIRFHSGRSTIHFSAEGVVAPGSPAPDLAGDLVIEDGLLGLPEWGHTLENVFARARFDQTSITVEELRGDFLSSRIEGRGEVGIKTGVLENVDVVFEGLSWNDVAALLGTPDLELRGSADISAGLSGPIKSPIVDIELESGPMSVREISFDRLIAELVLSEEGVEVRGAEAYSMGGTLSLAGLLRRAGETGRWTLDLTGDAHGLDVSQLLARVGIERAGGSLDLAGVAVRGRPGSFDIEALAFWSDASVAGLSLGSGAGGVQVREDDLVFTIRSETDSYQMQGEVYDAFGSPSLDVELSFRDCPCGRLMADLPPLLGGLSLDGGVSLVGPIGDFVVDGEMAFVGEAGTDGTASVSGAWRRDRDVGTLRLEVAAPDARIREVAAPLEAELTVNGSELVVDRLELVGFVRAEGSVGLDSRHALKASAVASEADARETFRLLTGSDLPRGIDGLLFASVSFAGTLENPRASAQLQLGQAQTSVVPDLDAAAVATLEDGIVDLTEFVVRQSGVPVIEASGTADLDGEMAVTAVGEGIPGPLLGAGGSSRLDLTIGIGGRTRSPTFDCKIGGVDGTLLSIPYSSLDARITGANGVATIDPLVLEQGSTYRLTAAGRAPYAALFGGDESTEGTLTVELEGDPLAALAEMTPLLESARSQGTVSLVLVGDRTGTTVARGELDVREATLVPTAVFEKLSDVAARATVADGRLVSGHIEGLVDGRAIRLESHRGGSVGGRPLTPLVVAGVDLGSLALSTDSEGVNANVPGLMLPGEVGKIAARGRDGAAELMVCGPPQRPFIWGELEISDMSVTYPFVGTDGLFGGDFLSDAEWSLSAVAGRKHWYWRAAANLLIDRGSRLDFEGLPSEGSFCVAGQVSSSRGTITYLNRDFSVRDAFVDFPSFCEPPRLFAEGATRVEDGTTITLMVNSLETALTVGAPGTTLDESAVVLASDSPDDNTHEKILSKLQYGVSYDMLEGEEQASVGRRQAVEVVGNQINSRVVRPLLTPIESQMKKSLRLDLVRINVDFIQNFLTRLDQWEAQTGSSEYQPFLADTRLTLGKYISADWLLSYSGVAEPHEEDIGEHELSVRHELGIEYEVSRNTSLSYRVVYDPTFAGWDRRISVENRYRF